MRSFLLFPLLGLLLAGCPEPSRNEVPVAPESTVTLPEQVPTEKPAETAAPTTPPPPAGTGEATQPDKTGRMAKPGWCQQDTDCPSGQVCEQCTGEKCCTPGCHSDAQCPTGQHCKQVQCIRAPCPSMCEGGSGPSPQGAPAPAPRPAAPVK